MNCLLMTKKQVEREKKKERKKKVFSFSEMSQPAYSSEIKKYFSSGKNQSAQECSCSSTGKAPCKRIQNALADGDFKKLKTLASTNHSFEGASLLLSVRHCGDPCTRLILENGGKKDGVEALKQAQGSDLKSTIDLLSQFESSAI